MDEQNEKELLEKVEKAAEKGASKAGLKSSLLSAIPTIVIILVLAVLIVPKINMMSNFFGDHLKTEDDVEGHDLTLSNNGIFGYTVADFEEAILGDSTKLKKLEVYKQEITDVATITNAGLLKLSVFTKSQLITYFGEVIYTVDLQDMSKDDIKLDEETKVITLYIPHCKQEEINIPEDKIQFDDPQKGLLAFGDINISPEETMKVQAEARKKMQQKLDERNVIETADRFAKLSVWEMYSPIIKGVAKDYSLEVEFKD